MNPSDAHNFVNATYLGDAGGMRRVLLFDDGLQNHTWLVPTAAGAFVAVAMIAGTDAEFYDGQTGTRLSWIAAAERLSYDSPGYSCSGLVTGGAAITTIANRLNGGVTPP